MISGETEPWYNLALEEELLGQVQGNVILYLWQNERTVVIGRNQNPYRECSLKYLDCHQIHLARRLSGGGAVYHDLGNLNYTFLMPGSLGAMERQTLVICQAIESLGISCGFSGRNDLLHEGKKFSGQACYTDGNASFLHGTLLVKTCLNQMAKALSPSPVKLSSKGTGSVRNRVMNLSDIQKDLDIQTVAGAVIRSFRKSFGPFQGPEILSRKTCVPSAYGKYTTSRWNLGNCPSYSAVMDLKLPEGIFRVEANVWQGSITRAHVYSDVLKEFDPQAAGAALTGCMFEEKKIRPLLERILAGAGNKSF